MPASSSRRNSSSSDAAAPAASHHVGDHAEVDDGVRLDQRPGSASTGSRGRTQQIASGSTPRPSSQTQASVAVLPEPTTTYWLGCLLPAHEVVDRDHPGTLGHAEPRRRLRRDVGGEVARVDDPAALGHLEPLPRVDARRRCGRRRSRSRRRTRPGPSRPSGPPARRRSRRRSSAGRPARAGPPRARSPGSVRRRAPSTRRRRRWRPGAAARTGRRRASGRPTPCRRSTRATRTSAWSISASVNAMPIAPAPTTR